MMGLVYSRGSLYILLAIVQVVILVCTYSPSYSINLSGFQVVLECHGHGMYSVDGFNVNMSKHLGLEGCIYFYRTISCHP